MPPYEMTATFPDIHGQRFEEERKWLSEDEMIREQIQNIPQRGKELELPSCHENRFFADTPYYDAFVEKEIKSAELLSATLRDIATNGESFMRATKALLESFRSLSLSCGQFSDEMYQGTDQTQVELIPGISMLQMLGETLEEISAAHDTMFDVINSFLLFQLPNLSAKQIEVISELKKKKKEADIQTRHSEKEFFKYLNGKNAAGNCNNFTDTNHTEPRKSLESSQARSHEHGWLQRIRMEETTAELKRFQLIKNIVDNNSNKSTDPNPTEPRKSLESLKARSHEHRWLQRIRMEETTAELKRFQLIKNIVQANYDRRVCLENGSEELLRAMHDCFQTCLKKVDKVRPYIDEDQKQCSDYQETKAPVWEEREKSLIQTLTTMKRAGEIASPHATSEEELTGIERDTEIWDLPHKLATVSKFCRPSPQDVLMEGWLYQKCSSIMSLQLSWVRRWIILESNAIYYLESSADGRFKVKLFDLVLCVARELPDKPSARFCFEIIDSSNKSIVLQARGPKELQIWLDRIRSAVGSELAKDNPQPEKGFNAIHRVNSETEFTKLVRQAWQFLDQEGTSTSESVLSDSDISEVSSTSGMHRPSIAENPLIMQVLKANPKCADCGAGSPDWASLNLGILVCLECSGVHRSLGCHVSKVRSLTLDTFSDDEASLLLSLGNERVNKIWEKEMKPAGKAMKEACSQDRSAREDWIKSKYVKKEFIGNNNNLNAKQEEKLSRELYAACKKGDIIGVATALGHGAKLDWKNEEDGACTALGISIKREHDGKNGAVECTQFLVQNGAKTA